MLSRVHALLIWRQNMRRSGHSAHMIGLYTIKMVGIPDWSLKGFKFFPNRNREERLSYIGLFTCRKRANCSDGKTYFVFCGVYTFLGKRQIVYMYGNGEFLTSSKEFHQMKTDLLILDSYQCLTKIRIKIRFVRRSSLLLWKHSKHLPTTSCMRNRFKCRRNNTRIIEAYIDSVERETKQRL